MTTTGHRPCIDDLAPGWRFRARTAGAPERGRWHEFVGWHHSIYGPMIAARYAGRASWHFVIPSAVVESSITPPIRREEP